MRDMPFAPVVVAFHLFLLTVSPPAKAEGLKIHQEKSASLSPIVWQLKGATHVYGLSEIRPNKKGTLVLDADALTFTGGGGSTSIPRALVTAVSAGSERVEMGGVGMRVVRMMIPDGGGLAAAAVMHHRVDLLTVEYRDREQGSHAAVFLLPAKEAAQVLQSFAVVPSPVRAEEPRVCEAGANDPRGVLVASPDWDKVEVPAAYRALVYEHLVTRLRAVSAAGQVYRAGEDESASLGGGSVCPQYTVHIAITGFKEGSSVARAALGPAGLFVGTTQMKFDVKVTDAAGAVKSEEAVQATLRGESESTSVADHVAKKVAKQYAELLRSTEKAEEKRPAETVAVKAFR